MAIQPAASLVPWGTWAPLGVVILLCQIAITRLTLRPGGRRLLLSAAALLLADILVALLVRVCTASMGAMDYSERFFAWRLWFLALTMALVPLPIGLWAVALRLSNGPARHGSRPPVINPIFLAALLSWVAAVLAAFVAGGDLSFVPRPAQITEMGVELRGLPRQFEGFRIAVLSDHHIGSLMTPARGRRRLDSLDRVRPDLIVDTGDITEMDPRYQAEAAAILGEHRARYGSYAVSGNFDVVCGTDSLRQQLGKHGVTYLENVATRISRGGADLWLVGLGDPWTGQADLGKALAKVPPSATRIVLSHSPDIIEDAVARRVPLVVSGHLHGGQIVAPFGGPIVGMSRFGTRFASGRFALGETQLVVSRGLGEEAVPLRLFCRPEIVVITLRRGPEPAENGQ